MSQLLIKLLLLGALATSLQFLIVSGDAERTLDRFEAVLDQKPDVLFFGDSTNGAWDPRDDDRRAISTFLDGRLTSASVGGFAHAAYHAEVYELYFNRLVDTRNLPRVVVVPINLRSISPVWDHDPSTQLATVQRRLAVEANVWRRMFEPLAQTLGVGRNATISRREYMSQPVYQGPQLVGRVSQFRNGTIDQQLVLNYMYALEESHRKVAALARIAETARTHEIAVLFYVTPVDYRAARAELLPALVEQIAMNVDVIRRALTGSGAVLVNLAFELDSEGFSYGRHVNEHLRSAGRTYVANRLAEIIEPVRQNRNELLAADPNVLLR